jgi:hypothetical protein
LGVTRGDSLAKVSPKQFPSRLPTVTLDQAAQSQDGLSASLGPSHPGLFETLSDERFASCFHHPTGNRQAIADVLGIVHPGSLIAKVSQLGFQSFPFTASGATTMVLQDPNNPFGPIILFFKQYFQTLKLSFTAGGTFTPGLKSGRTATTLATSVSSWC